MNKEKIIAAMEMAGYYYDDIDSYDDWLVFNADFGSRLDFSSWDNVLDWLENVVFDDNEVSDNVEKILHPERF